MGDGGGIGNPALRRASPGRSPRPKGRFVSTVSQRGLSVGLPLHPSPTETWICRQNLGQRRRGSWTSSRRPRVLLSPFGKHTGAVRLGATHGVCGECVRRHGSNGSTALSPCRSRARPCRGLNLTCLVVTLLLSARDDDHATPGHRSVHDRLDSPILPDVARHEILP